MPEITAAQGVKLTLVGENLNVSSDPLLTNYPLTANYTLAAGDGGKTFQCSGTFTVTVPDTLPALFYCTFLNLGTGVVSFVASGTAVLVPSTPKLDNTDVEITAATVIRGATGSNVYVLGGEEPDTVTTVYSAGWPATRPFATHVWAVGHTSAPSWLTAADVWLEAVA